MENINPKPRGDPSVELVISSSGNGDITADATDLDPSVKAEHLHLNVSLKSLDEDNRDFDNFELEQNEPPPQGLYEKAKEARKDADSTRKFPWIVVIIGVVIILICLGLWFFLFRGNSGSSQPKPADNKPAVEKPAEPAPPVEVPPPQSEPAVVTPPAPAPAAPVIEAPKAAPAQTAQPAARRNRPPAPVSSYKVPAVIPPGGVTYRIRWGDTLWDVAAAFYRNPWLYTKIARDNNIRNPNRIISGTTIRIRPKN
jgi:nucleoid-associated protein YgaU